MKKIIRTAFLIGGLLTMGESWSPLCASAEPVVADVKALQQEVFDLGVKNQSLRVDNAVHNQELELLRLKIDACQKKRNRQDELERLMDTIEKEKVDLQHQVAILAQVNKNAEERQKDYQERAVVRYSKQAENYIKLQVRTLDLARQIETFQKEKIKLRQDLDEAIKANAVLEKNYRELERRKPASLLEKPAKGEVKEPAEASEAEKLIERLVEQKSALEKENDRLVNLNHQVEQRSQEMAKKARAIVNNEGREVIKKGFYRVNVPRIVKGLEDQKADLRKENERLAKLNADLERKSREDIDKARAMVARQARELIRVYPRRIDVPKVVKKVEAQKETLKKENERLTGLNAQLEANNKDLCLKINALQGKVQGGEAVSRTASQLTAEVAALKGENSRMKAQLDFFHKKLDTERASVYREAGATYAQSGLFEEAINAYSESLKLDPADPMTYYFLGLLYSKVDKDVDAVQFFKKYLVLVPKAENREEVEYFMSILLGRSEMMINGK